MQRFCPQCLATEQAEDRETCGTCQVALRPLMDESGAMSREYLAARGSCCNSGCRNCPYPQTKTCQRCGGTFECRGEACWCSDVRLGPDVLQKLRNSYSDCLCPACLRSVDIPAPAVTVRGMFRVTRHGAREMLIGSVVLAVVAVVLGQFVFWPLALLIIPVLVWLFAFFRDPERQIPADQDVMVSPADGTVSDVSELPYDDYLKGPAVRVGIFLSVFNVHINRSPCDGVVLETHYKKGKFINAMRHQLASDENESNTVVLGDPQTKQPSAVVRQIVGLIARRIIFSADKGQMLRRGERIGMIKFGSRTELTVPKWMEPQVVVKVGQTVRGGADILVKLGKPIHTTVPAPHQPEEFERAAPRETPA